MSLRIALHLIVSILALTGSSSFAQEEEPAELLDFRGAYYRDLDFSARPIRDRYLSKLELLKKTLGGRGDARGAVAVQEEIDKIRTESGGMAAAGKLAGLWTFDFGGATVWKLTIKADGTASLHEAGGQSSNLRGRIFLRGADSVLEFDGMNSVTRIVPSGSKLVLEDFSPRTSYPKGPPTGRGTGLRSSTPKP